MRPERPLLPYCRNPSRGGQRHVGSENHTVRLFCEVSFSSCTEARARGVQMVPKSTSFSEVRPFCEIYVKLPRKIALPIADSPCF